MKKGNYNLSLIDLTVSAEKALILQFDAIDSYGNVLDYGNDSFIITLQDQLGRYVDSFVLTPLCNGSYQAVFNPLPQTYNLTIYAGCVQTGYSIVYTSNVTFTGSAYIFFDNTGSRLVAYFPAATNMPYMVRNGSYGDFACSLLITNPEILGQNPTCSWLDPFTLNIFLGNNATATINGSLFFNHSGIFLTPDGKTYPGPAANGGAYTNPNISYGPDYIDPYSPTPNPYVTISAPQLINICQTLKITATQSWHLGARNLYWNWTIADGSPNVDVIRSLISVETGPSITFSATLVAQLFEPTCTYNFSVYVQNHLGYNTTFNFSIQVSLDPSPGVSVYPNYNSVWSSDEIKFSACVEPSGCVSEQSSNNLNVLWAPVGSVVSFSPSEFTTSQNTLVVSPNTLSYNDSYNLVARSTNANILPTIGDYVQKVEVVPKAPYFYVEGGNRRLFPLGRNSLNLKITNLMDYDNRADVPFNIEWSCTFVTESCLNFYRQYDSRYYPNVACDSKLANPCFDADTVSSYFNSSNTISIPSYAFGLAIYNFTVTVSKAGGIPSSQSIIIQTNGTGPQVFVDVEELKSENKISSKTQIFLVGNGIWQTDFGGVTYKWSIPTNNLDLTDTNISPCGTDMSYLVINPGVLSSRVWYVFRLEVSNNEGLGWAEYGVFTNDFPRGGVCELLPAQNQYIAYVDTVTLLCYQWEDDHTFLKYKFYMELSYANSSGMRIPLAPGFWYSNQIDLILPPGEVNFYIEIYDRFEESFTATTLSTATTIGSSVNPIAAFFVNSSSQRLGSSRDLSQSPPADIALLLAEYLNQTLLQQDTRNIGTYSLYILIQVRESISNSSALSIRTRLRNFVLDLVRFELKTEKRLDIIDYKLRLLAMVVENPADLETSTICKVYEFLSDLSQQLTEFTVTGESIYNTYFLVLDKIGSVTNSTPSLYNVTSAIVNNLLQVASENLQPGETASYSGLIVSYTASSDLSKTISTENSSVTIPASLQNLLNPVINGQTTGQTLVASIVQWNIDRTPFARNLPPLFSPTVSVEIRNSSGDLIPITNSPDPIIIQIPTNTPNPTNSSSSGFLATCLFFNGTSFIGDGCSVAAQTTTTTYCSCTHLTDFVVTLQEQFYSSSTQSPTSPPSIGRALLNYIDIILIVLIGGISLLIVIVLVVLRKYYEKEVDRTGYDKLPKISDYAYSRLPPGGDYNRLESAQIDHLYVPIPQKSRFTGMDMADGDTTEEFDTEDFVREKGKEEFSNDEMTEIEDRYSDQGKRRFYRETKPRYVYKKVMREEDTSDYDDQNDEETEKVKPREENEYDDFDESDEVEDRLRTSSVVPNLYRRTGRK